MAGDGSDFMNLSKNWDLIAREVESKIKFLQVEAETHFLSPVEDEGMKIDHY